jgi:hypothetical protein
LFALVESSGISSPEDQYAVTILHIKLPGKRKIQDMDVDSTLSRKVLSVDVPCFFNWLICFPSTASSEKALGSDHVYPQGHSKGSASTSCLFLNFQYVNFQLFFWTFPDINLGLFQ